MMGIENVTYESFGNPVFAYRIKANEGYVIQLSTQEAWEYSKIVVVPACYDMDTVKVISESTLPEQPSTTTSDNIDYLSETDQKVL